MRTRAEGPGQGLEQVSEALLKQVLRDREKTVSAYLSSRLAEETLGHEHLTRAAHSYLRRDGKKLRSTVLMLSTAAVGGNPEAALPAAAGIELFHTWTLVHDDLIDNDSTRRGGPSAHEEVRQIALASGAFSPQEAEEYGRDIAILAGDVQHGWAVSLFAECAREDKVSPAVVLTLIRTLESKVLGDLARGQALDIEYSRRPIGDVALEETLLMEGLKTGALYEFAAQAGAMIGLGSADTERPEVRTLSEFGRLCGGAFQLQDDILGIIGDEEALGKPVGSDIREGKRTPIVYFAFRNGNKEERARLSAVLGNRQATKEEIGEAKEILLALGGVDKARELAERGVEDGVRRLQELPPSFEREVLASLARYMITRSV